MSKLPTIHQISSVASSRLFHVEELHLEFSNGERRIYERLANRGGGAVLIVPLLNDDTLLLVREYAAGTGRYELGFPKGKVVSLSDSYVTVEVAANTQIIVQKQAIGAVLPKGTIKSI